MNDARAWIAAAACALASVTACRGGGGASAPPDAGPADEARAAVLAAFGECAAGAYRTFEPQAAALAAAAAASPPDAERARQAWRTAMSAWQVAELFVFGPAAPHTLPGGRDLRDQIYAWPLFSRCLVEQELVDRGYERPDFVATAGISVRTLAAAEYLLFHEGTDNGCGPTVPLNATGSWQALAPAELAARKRAYAAVVSADIAARARELVRAWAPDGENFGRELSSAGFGSRVFASSQAAFNAINVALFYIEIQAKDQKVGPPVGRNDCMTPTCPERLESRFAGYGKEELRRNLEGTRKLLFGCGPGGDGLAFDDLLAAKGEAALVETLRAQVAAVEGALEAIPGDSLAEALRASLPAMLALHDALRALSNTLKTQFVGVLNLEIPKAAEADND
jgi:uncharacterized protein